MTDHLRAFIRRHVVETVPDEMDLCLSCKQPTCTAAAFRHCAHRLQRLDDLRAADALPPAPPTNTDSRPAQAVSAKPS